MHGQLAVVRFGKPHQLLHGIAPRRQVHQPASLQGSDRFANEQAVRRLVPRRRSPHHAQEQAFAVRYGCKPRIVFILDLEPEGFAQQVRAQDQPLGRVPRVGEIEVRPTTCRGATQHGALPTHANHALDGVRIGPPERLSRRNPELKLRQWRPVSEAGVRRCVVVGDQRVEQLLCILQLECRRIGDHDRIGAPLVRRSAARRGRQSMETARGKAAEERLDEGTIILAAPARVAVCTLRFEEPAADNLLQGVLDPVADVGQRAVHTEFVPTGAGQVRRDEGRQPGAFGVGVFAEMQLARRPRRQRPFDGPQHVLGRALPAQAEVITQHHPARHVQQHDDPQPVDLAHFVPAVR